MLKMYFDIFLFDRENGEEVGHGQVDDKVCMIWIDTIVNYIVVYGFLNTIIPTSSQKYTHIRE